MPFERRQVGASKRQLTEYVAAQCAFETQIRQRCQGSANAAKVVTPSKIDVEVFRVVLGSKPSYR